MTTKGTPQMRRSLRAALLGTAVVATLALAGSALAANTGTVAVWHTPMALGSVQSTTVHFNVPQTTDPVAAVNIYVPSGYRVNASQTVGSNIGNVDATAFSYDNQLTLPLSGTVTVDDPSKHATDSAQCTGVAQSAAVWILNLSVAGNTIALPVYVNPTAGAETALGAYKISVCLPPPDVPVGTPGRSANGAQVLDAKFTVNGVIQPPTTGGVLRWEALVTPYTPKIGQVNRAGTFEARALVPLPIAATPKVKVNKKKHSYTITGRVTEGGLPVAGLALTYLTGAKSATSKSGTITTTAAGSFTKTGKVGKKKVLYAKVTGTTKERDATATGCQSPAPPTVAPGGCVSATLSPWTVTSAAVKIVG
jgi:hypothetical protein